MMRRVGNAGRVNNRIKKRDIIKKGLERLTASDFSGPMAFLLVQIHDEGGQVPLSVIKEKFVLLWNERTFNRYLNRLELLQLIERKEGIFGFSDDLRRKMLRLTSLGMHVVSKFYTEFKQQPHRPLKRGPNLSKNVRKLIKIVRNDPQ